MRDIYILFLGFIFYNPLGALLDGRAAPIYLETRYSFSNFEYARGRVLFRKGFDLPVNGTVILDITDPVSDNILFHNSTLVLANNLTLNQTSSISGQGFIDFRGNAIIFTSDQKLTAGDHFIITSPGSIEGTISTILDLEQGSFGFTSSLSHFLFDKIVLKSPTSISFPTSIQSPSALTLKNIILVLSSTDTNFALSSNFVRADNFFTILGERGSVLTIDNELQLLANTEVLVSSGLSLAADQIGAVNTQGGLILDNAKLHYTSSATSSLAFKSISPILPGRGRLNLLGPCDLSAPGGALFFQDNSILQFNSGARLSILSGTHFDIF